jgi:acetyltransferase-like isoleucine patch superfamily enzyme
VRLLIIGGGLGCTQVQDICASQELPLNVSCAIADDNCALWGKEVHGLPCWGGTDADKLAQWLADERFDEAVIAISTSIRARVKLREKCDNLGVPLASVVHDTAYVADTAKLGRGNVVCAFCHIGAHSVIGANNFFSAYNSFDHHNVIGSDCSTGPANATSGIVTIGSRVRMGMGGHVEPHWHIGDDAFIASGCLIRQDIPAGARVMQTGARLIIQQSGG